MEHIHDDPVASRHAVREMHPSTSYLAAKVAPITHVVFVNLIDGRWRINDIIILELLIKTVIEKRVLRRIGIFLGDRDMGLVIFLMKLNSILEFLFRKC